MVKILNTITSREGRAINMTGDNGKDKIVGKTLGMSEKIGAMLSAGVFAGRLNLVRLDGRDIKVESGNTSDAKFSTAFSLGANGVGGNQQSVSLKF